MKESITRKRQAPSIATVGSTCDLNLKIPGTLPLLLFLPASCLLLPRLYLILLNPFLIFPTCLLLLLAVGNWFQMVSAQERLTRTFTRSSHTYTRTERTEISKTRAGETKREVRVEESTQVGGDPFRDVFGGFLGRESLSGLGGMPAGSRPPLQDGVCLWSFYLLLLLLFAQTFCL